MKRHNRAYLISALFIPAYLIVLFTIPTTQINIVFPLALLPSVAIGVYLGPWVGGAAALLCAAMNVAYLLIRYPAYLETGSVGFIVGHFNILFASVVAGYFSRLWRLYKEETEKRRRTETELEKALENQEMLIHEVHHRVSNQLSMLAAMVQIQSGYMVNEQNREKFMELKERILTIALVQRQLYRRQESSDLCFREYVETLTEKVSESLTREGQDIRFRLTIPELFLSADIATALGLIIVELLTNAYKYAFPDGRSGTIKIAVSENTAGRRTLYVENDGVPIPDNFDMEKKSGSLGLSLVHSLAAQLGGSVRLERRDATCFVIDFLEKGYG